MKPKIPFVGSFLMLAALGLNIAALILGIFVYRVFGYALDRWGIFVSVAALWFTAFLLIEGILMGEKPRWVGVFYAAICVCLVFAAVLFIRPCLSPIGIYFTVHNMGDVAANAVGVPLSIVTASLYVGALLCVAVASFIPAVWDKEVRSL